LFKGKLIIFTCGIQITNSSKSWKKRNHSLLDQVSGALKMKRFVVNALNKLSLVFIFDSLALQVRIFLKYL